MLEIEVAMPMLKDLILSILYLRCAAGRRVAMPKMCAEAFNSLFEMHKVELLRSREEEAMAFNSLFEMHFCFAGALFCCQALSILYLRCTYCQCQLPTWRLGCSFQFSI